MPQRADIRQRQPEEFAYTHRAFSRLVQANLDTQAVIRQHLTGIWDQYRGQTELVTDIGPTPYRFSLCWTGPDTCVMVGERAGILTICCPDDFADFTPPPGGPS